MQIVYLAAGLSKRFNGIKQLAKVGPNDETLIEYSATQAIRAGFNEIVLVVGHKTERPLKKLMGKSFLGVKVLYAKQEIDQNSRDSPWGTLDALYSAKNILKYPYVVCNGDDIYGKSSLMAIKEYLMTNTSDVAIGYKLSEVIPSRGSVNRGIFQTRVGYATSLREELGLTNENFLSRGLSHETLCSMSLFGLSEATTQKLEARLKSFKDTYRTNRTIECMLPQELGKMLEKKEIKMRVLPSLDGWTGLTNPQDEQVVKDRLKENTK